MAQAPVFYSNIWYRFVPNNTIDGIMNYCLDGYDDSLANGRANLTCHLSGDEDCQYWQVTATAHGSYQLCALEPDYKLGYYQSNGNTLPALFHDTSGNNQSQMWSITSISDGVFSVINQEQDRYLDVIGGVVVLVDNEYKENWGWLIIAGNEINDSWFSSTYTPSIAAVSNFVAPPLH